MGKRQAAGRSVIWDRSQILKVQAHAHALLLKLRGFHCLGLQYAKPMGCRGVKAVWSSNSGLVYICSLHGEHESA